MDAIHLLQQAASPTLDAAMLAITYFGAEAAYMALLVIIYLSLDSRIGRALGIALLISLTLNFALKALFDTARPYVLDPSLSRGPLAEASGTGPSFPSGHAQASATFWFLAALYFKRRWLYPLSLLVVGLISLSRVYLGVHFIVDIVGGLALGILIAVAAYELGQLPRPPLGRSLQLLGGIGLPLALQLALGRQESVLLLGTLAAFMSAPALYRHQPPRTLSAKVALALLGLAVVFGALYLLPGALPGPLGSFIGYLLLGYSGLLLAPYLGRQLGLAHAAL